MTGSELAHGCVDELKPPSWLIAASAGCFGSALAIIIAAVAFVVWFHWTFDGRGM